MGAHPPSGAQAGRVPELKVGKCLALSVPGGHAANLEVFTLTLGSETIELLPFKNWTQLDHHKWTARGKLPTEPAGLEILAETLRIAGETVSVKDPAGCAKLERVFNDWLFFERETLALARSKAQRHAAAVSSGTALESQPLRFQVEVDKRAQVHIHCLQGRDTLASVGLTVAGFHSLVHQGLLRKPQSLETGALHDWVQLDGELCSFEKGRNDAPRLEQLLNGRYLPVAELRSGKAVVVSLNAASPTGFDIQFPVMVGGELDNHRHHLNDQALELLQDPDHCGLLQKGIIVKLIAPNLVFKQKTSDGGEEYLAWRPDNIVTVTDEDGREKAIQLSQPLNLMRVTAADLTAVFNHPTINRHAKARTPTESPGNRWETPAVSPIAAQGPPSPVAPVVQRRQPLAINEPKPEQSCEQRSRQQPNPSPAPLEQSARQPPVEAQPLPNLWLKELLERPRLQHDWFACLAYSKMAEMFGNSAEGKFGPAACWFISMGEKENLDDPEFKGVFLTEKGGLGFLSAGHMARFYNGVGFLGSRDSALEGIQVRLLALGLSERQELAFIVNDDYRARFGVSETALEGVLEKLRQSGAAVMSVTEVLASRTALNVVWTVPAEQLDPNEPEALQSVRPAVCSTA